MARKTKANSASAKLRLAHVIWDAGKSALAASVLGSSGLGLVQGAQQITELLVVRIVKVLVY